MVVNFGSALQGVPGMLGWPIKARAGEIRFRAVAQWSPEWTPVLVLLAGTLHHIPGPKDNGDDEMLTIHIVRQGPENISKNGQTSYSSMVARDSGPKTPPFLDARCH